MTDVLAEFPALRKAPLLVSLSDRHFNGLMGVLDRRRVAPGQVVFQQGHTGDSMAVVAQGTLRVTVRAAGGDDVEVGRLGPGDVVGEMACVDPAPRSATVTALTGGTVFVLSRAMLQALRRKGPSVARAILTGVLDQVTHRLRSTNDLLNDRLGGTTGGTEPMVKVTGPSFREADLLRPRLSQQAVDPGVIPALQSFSDAQRRALVQVARRLAFPEGSLLCREGEAGDSCFIVVRGDVEIYKQVDGSPRLLTTLSRCLLGQMALVAPGPRSATLRAGSDVLALELTRDTFELLLSERSPFALAFLDLLAVTGIRQLREATERIALTGISLPASAPAATVRARPRPQPQPRERRAPTRERQAPPPDSMRHTLAYMQASLKEWGMSLEDLDRVEVSRPAGVMTQAEIKARQRKW